MSSLPSTRLISWQQVVLDADPEWHEKMQRPWIYQFSTGRRFYWRPDIYTVDAPSFLEDSDGTILEDSDGSQIADV